MDKWHVKFWKSVELKILEITPTNLDLFFIFVFAVLIFNFLSFNLNICF